MEKQPEEINIEQVQQVQEPEEIFVDKDTYLQDADDEKLHELLASTREELVRREKIDGSSEFDHLMYEFLMEVRAYVLKYPFQDIDKLIKWEAKRDLEYIIQYVDDQAKKYEP